MLVLCASCKSYSDAWEPFCTLFQRFWPDCPYRKVLFSDMPAVMPDLHGFSFTDIGTDRGWVQNLLDVLTFSNFETVMFFQEDFFLCYPVDQPRMARIVEWFEKSEYDICRLYPCPGANDEREVFPGIGEMTLYAPYRSSCQTAIYKREKLMELCRRLLANGFPKIQQFELQGSRLIDDFKICGWIRKAGEHPSTWPVSYQCSAIANGKWMSGAVGFCMSQGILLNPKRDVIYADTADDAILKNRYYEFIQEMEAKP